MNGCPPPAGGDAWRWDEAEGIAALLAPALGEGWHLEPALDDTGIVLLASGPDGQVQLRQDGRSLRWRGECRGRAVYGSAPWPNDGTPEAGSEPGRLSFSQLLPDIFVSPQPEPRPER